MKKITLFFTLFVAVTVLTACGNEQETSIQQEESVNSNTVTDENVV